jgi:hypothetical protein
LELPFEFVVQVLELGNVCRVAILPGVNAIEFALWVFAEKAGNNEATTPFKGPNLHTRDWLVCRRAVWIGCTDRGFNMI